MASPYNSAPWASDYGVIESYKASINLLANKASARVSEPGLTFALISFFIFEYMIVCLGL